MVNPWLVIPHGFEPMPEPEFRELCRVCGGHRINTPHPGNVMEQFRPAPAAQGKAEA